MQLDREVIDQGIRHYLLHFERAWLVDRRPGLAHVLWTMSAHRFQKQTKLFLFEHCAGGGGDIATAREARISIGGHLSTHCAHVSSDYDAWQTQAPAL